MEQSLRSLILNDELDFPSDRNARVFIVEDEIITSMEIRDKLTRIGFDVVGDAVSGEKALEQMERASPDIVLMDIKLNGKLDGIETASAVFRRFRIPIIYLTAFSDEETMLRARMSRPFSYLLKPFSDSELTIAIEISLMRSTMERLCLEGKQWFASLLKHTRDAVLFTDPVGLVQFLNPAAERLMDRSEKDVIGGSIDELLELPSANGKRSLPVSRMLKDPKSPKKRYGRIRLAGNGDSPVLNGTCKNVKNHFNETLGLMVILENG